MGQPFVYQRRDDREERSMKAELLAPAGSYESLIAAVNAGADAVYIGGSRFGARAYADNPQPDLLIQGLHYCHLHGAKMYLTVNTLLKERELEEELYPCLAHLYEQGLDAVIVQDLGVLSYVREQFPDLDIHASTQMTLTGADSCAFLEEQGVSRVVLSRELGLEEIRQIREKIQGEIEAFVHGALCYCYSGQCLLSSMIGGRSGNRGRCAQPCRLPYGLSDGKKEMKRGGEPYLLSPKDICTLEILPDILEAGVFSLKIEGRMKRPEYTAGVVRVYRKYVDLYLKNGRDGYTVSEKDLLELMDLYNRGGFSKGYFVQHSGRNMMSTARPNHNGTQAAKVQKLGKGSLKMKALKPLYPGDVLELPGRKGEKPKEIRLRDAVNRGMEFQIKLPGGCMAAPEQILRRVRREQLLEELKAFYVDGERQEKINGNLKIFLGQPAILTVSMGSHQVSAMGGEATPARKQPLEEGTVRRQMEKTGNTPFVFDKLEITIEDGCFLPVQSLNALRRQALEELERAVLEADKREIPSQRKGAYWEQEERPWTLRVSLENTEAFEGLLTVPGISGIYLDSACFPQGLSQAQVRPYLEQCHRASKKCYYIMPWIFRKSMQERYDCEECRRGLFLFDGILVKNIESFVFLKKSGYAGEILLDHNLYTYNRRASMFWREQGVAMDTAPLELNARELKERGCHGSELVVYGYLPVMVSAQCLHKTAARCVKRQELMYLKDRKGKEFPVKNFCLPCYQVVYNCAPLKLEDCYREIRELGPASLRLSFTSEAAGEVLEITRRYAARFLENREIPLCDGAFTRGHFKRGIE